MRPDSRLPRKISATTAVIRLAARARPDSRIAPDLVARAKHCVNTYRLAIKHAKNVSMRVSTRQAARDQP